MTKEKLLKTVYDFFPKDIDCLREKSLYKKTKQYIRLSEQIKTHCNPYPKKINEIIEELNDIYLYDFNFNDASLFEWEDRCYTFEFIKNIDNSSFILRIYLSIISPYFTIKCFNVLEKNGRYKYTTVLIDSILNTDLIYELKNNIKTYGYLEIQDSILSETINNINFQDIPMGDFTFFNAFFLNQSI